MLNRIRVKVATFFTKGHERSIKAKKNIIISFLLKGISIAIGFVLIPMTIKYVNPTEYGIWLTLSSLIAWINFFDIGLGNGLKNKLAEAKALGNNEKARIYISTTYAILTIISLIIFTSFCLINPFINWGKILNTKNTNELNNLVLYFISFFCLQFILQLINTVLTALHAPSKVSVINVIGQFCCLISIFILTQKPNGSLFNLVIIFAGIPLFIQFIASLYFFKTSYKSFAPAYEYIKFSEARKLLSDGSIFFILQIGALILFQTDNIVISQLLGPKEVTTFNIAYKLFSVFIMAFTIILTPFWSAYTDAYSKKDFEWIKSTLFKMYRYWALLVIFVVCTLLVSPFVYKLWLHDQVQVPFILSVAMAFYVIVFTWQTIHIYLLNGIGKVKLQLYLVIISSIINIPLAVVTTKWIGLAGVVFSNAFIFLILGTILSVQCKNIIHKSEHIKVWTN